jgi:hypothetical protein
MVSNRFQRGLRCAGGDRSGGSGRVLLKKKGLTQRILHGAVKKGWDEFGEAEKVRIFALRKREMRGVV